MKLFLSQLKGFAFLEKLNLTVIKNVQEYQLEDLEDLMRAFEDPS